MLQPTEEYCPPCLHTHLVRGGSVLLQPTMRRHRSKMVRSKAIQHQEPTSHEVGMESFRAANRENLTRYLRNRSLELVVIGGLISHGL